MTGKSAIVWFRRDLRTDDNPALAAALCAGASPVALYVLDDKPFFAPGAAQRWFLHHALVALSSRLAAIGVPLLVRRGDEAKMLASVARETRAAAVFWNRRYEPEGIATDKRLMAALKAEGCAVRSFNGSLLREPWEIETKTGGPYRVFTPFWKTLRALGPSRDMTPECSLMSAASSLPPDDVAALNLLPSSPDWAREFSDWWTPSQAGADAALERFMASAAGSYADDRDRPDLDGTSRLSPYLALGAISPLKVWRALGQAAANEEAPEAAVEKFLFELAWREFAYHLLFHFPSIVNQPLRAEFARFPWRDDDAAFKAWTRGETGIPIVDAGMRQLWRTGWMHNRVRMIAASFLTKNLLIDWRRGERWFWDTLVDADPASNPVSWQWVAGSGADAAPYFRIFNPVTQGEKFDPEGAYVRRFVPEIAALPNSAVHKPQGAPDAAGSTVLTRPVVDLGHSRNRALAAYRSLSAQKPQI